MWFKKSFILGGLIMASMAFADDVEINEIWIRPGKITGGNGTETAPLAVAGPDGLDRLFLQLEKKYGSHLKMNFAPGIYYGTQHWKPASFWTIKGAGMDKTIFKTAPNPEATKTIGFGAATYQGTTDHFAISDLTFDFNINQLRGANWAFLHKSCVNKPRIAYYYAKKLKEWEPDKNYYATKLRRYCQNAARYKGLEYIQVKADKKKAVPENNPCWRRLQPMAPDLLPKWDETRGYMPNDAIQHHKQGFICIRKCAGKQTSDLDFWRPIKTNAPDPRILTKAIFFGGKPPLGNHRVERVKAINANGSALHDKEDFVIGLGGNNCLIKDCIVEKFHGTYASLIVVKYGAGSKVVNCKVYGNGECFAYGGWGCVDTVFENNYCENVNSGVNIDSLNNRNVTFRNNTFKRCRRTGILINASGGTYVDAYLKKLTMPYGDETISMGKMQMHGLTIENNTIEMVDGAPFAALQLQAAGLDKGIVRNNKLSKTNGRNGACAIGLFRSSNLQVTDNTCAPGMYLKNEGTNNSFKNNLHPNGQLVAGAPRRPIARINIIAEKGLELEINGASTETIMKYATWRKENRKEYIFCQSQALGDAWEPMKLSFTPKADGQVAIELCSAFPQKDTLTQKTVPNWVCFDALECQGTSLKDLDFEAVPEGENPPWSGPAKQKMTTAPKLAFSGDNYVLAQLSSPLRQSAKVKKGQTVTITAWIKAATEAERSKQ